MKYYALKYTDELPDWVGGQAKGPFIKIRPKHKHDAGILEHEKFHVRQWWGGAAAALLIAVILGIMAAPAELVGVIAGLAGSVHPLAYRLVRPYRQWSEVQAYRVQLRVYGPSASPAFAIRALVDKYDLRLSDAEARRLLRA